MAPIMGCCPADGRQRDLQARFTANPTEWVSFVCEGKPAHCVWQACFQVDMTPLLG